MRNFVLAAVVALMAVPALADDQQVRTESDTYIVEPVLSDTIPTIPSEDEAAVDEAVPEGLLAQGGYYRRGWACLWGSGTRYYYTRSWARSYAYYGGYNTCGYRSTCVCSGCYQSGWWLWNGVTWRYWR